jgi:hypothetical protein
MRMELYVIFPSQGRPRDAFGKSYNTTMSYCRSKILQEIICRFLNPFALN